jgi:hypothetical protein
MTTPELPEVSPQVWGDNDITIAVSPTGRTKVYAGQTQLTAIESITIKVENGIPRVDITWPTLEGPPEEQHASVFALIEHNKVLVKNFPQVIVNGK